MDVQTDLIGKRHKFLDRTCRNGLRRIHVGGRLDACNCLISDLPQALGGEVRAHVLPVPDSLRAGFAGTPSIRQQAAELRRARYCVCRDLSTGQRGTPPVRAGVTRNVGAPPRHPVTAPVAAGERASPPRDRVTWADAVHSGSASPRSAHSNLLLRLCRLHSARLRRFRLTGDDPVGQIDRGQVPVEDPLQVELLVVVGALVGVLVPDPELVGQLE